MSIHASYSNTFPQFRSPTPILLSPFPINSAQTTEKKTSKHPQSHHRSRRVTRKARQNKYFRSIPLTLLFLLFLLSQRCVRRRHLSGGDFVPDPIFTLALDTPPVLLRLLYNLRNLRVLPTLTLGDHRRHQSRPMALVRDCKLGQEGIVLEAVIGDIAALGFDDSEEHIHHVWGEFVRSGRLVGEWGEVVGARVVEVGGGACAVGALGGWLMIVRCWVCVGGWGRCYW